MLGPRGGLCALLLTSILKPDLHLRRYRARVRVRSGAPRPVQNMARAGEVEVEIMLISSHVPAEPRRAADVRGGRAPRGREMQRPCTRPRGSCVACPWAPTGSAAAPDPSSPAFVGKCADFESSNAVGSFFEGDIRWRFPHEMTWKCPGAFRGCSARLRGSARA